MPLKERRQNFLIVGLVSIILLALVLFAAEATPILEYFYNQTNGTENQTGGGNQSGLPSGPLGELPCPNGMAGNGAESNPCQVTSWADLNAIRTQLTLYYVLTAGLSSSTPGYAGLGDSWVPIGDDTNQFTGSFNGNGNSISNLIIDLPSTNYVGLFGYTGSSSNITNVGLEDVSVSGGSSVGGLVGENYGSITSSYSTGSVTGTDNFVGGLAGNNDGSITSSRSTGSVTGTGDYVGGLVGISNILITSSYSTGSVNGSGSVGGLVGWNGGPITSSYSTGSVTGTGNFVGGLAGENYGPITSSNSTGNVSGTTFVGGLVGWNQAPITSSRSTGNVSGGTYVGGLVGNSLGSITSSNSTGRVSGSSYIGGLAGQNGWGGPITSSYATGSVLGTGDVVGGLVGQNGYSITSSYSTGNVSGSGSVGGLAGQNAGSITSSYSTGIVLGGWFTGGLVAFNIGSINSSYSTGNVSGIGGVGGLIGGNEGGSITFSYSTGSVTGTGPQVGGLVGYNHGPINSSYSTGSVSGGAIEVGGFIGANVIPEGTYPDCGWWIGAGPVNAIGDPVTPLITYNELLPSAFFDTAGTHDIYLNWSFPPWDSTSCDEFGYPPLEWQNITNPTECPGYVPCPNNMPGWGTEGNPCQIDACDDDLSVANRFYELQTNISATATCLEITADDIILDGNGKNITFNTGGIANSAGIYLPASRNSITIKNFAGINNGGGILPSDIMGVRAAAGLNNSVIANNSISTAGGFFLYGSNGISIIGASENNNLSNNTISTNSYGIYLFSSSSDTTISNNNINSNQAGIKFQSSSSGDTISNNTITSTSGLASYGLYFSSSSNTTISNNNITSTSGLDSYGIRLYSSSSDTISNNTITTSGAPPYDLVVGYVGCPPVLPCWADNLTLRDQTITTYNFGGPSNITVEDTTYGKIEFLDEIVGSGTNLTGAQGSPAVQIGYNYAYVNSTQPWLNRPANISLYNVSGSFTDPGAYRNGVPCGGVCTEFQNLGGGNYSFSVTGWTNYSVGENPVCPNSMPGLGTNASPCLIDACDDDPSLGNRFYELVDNISTTATCLNITVDDITLDGNGKNITFNNFIAPTGNNAGILLSGVRDNITIKDFAGINDGGVPVAPFEMMGVRANAGLSNSVIANNSIYTAGQFSPGGYGSNGISIIGASENNNLSNNNITSTNYNGIYFVSSSSGDTISNNTITSNSVLLASYGIYFQTSSSGDTISNNTITSTSGRGISFTSSSSDITISGNIITSHNEGLAFPLGTASFSDTTISNNNITSTNNNGISFSSSSSDTTISGNTITSTSIATFTYGISFSSSSSDTISNNTISTNGWGDNGIYIFSSSSDTISNNTITSTSTGSDTYGIYFQTSSSDTISNNTINSTSTGPGFTGYGIRFWTSSSDTTISNNTITTSGVPAASRYDLVVGFNLCAGLCWADNLTLRNQIITTYYFYGPVNLTVEDTTYGKIEFLNEIVAGTLGSYLTGAQGTTADIQIGYNYTYVNSILPSLNLSADISLYNLSGFTDPGAYRNGILCGPSVCTAVQDLGGGNYSFSVTGWTNYSIGENPRCPIGMFGNGTEEDPCNITSCADDPSLGNRFYALNASLPAVAGTCLTIEARNITLDCNGSTIDSGGVPTGNGIEDPGDYDDVTIKNCVITRFIQGIYFNGVDNSTITNNTASTNTIGIYLFNSSNNNLTNNNASSNTNRGIVLDSSSSNNLTNNTANYNPDSGIVLLLSSNYNTLTNNNANSNIGPTGGTGINLLNSFNNTFTNNNASSNGNAGISLAGGLGSSNNAFTDNTANSNTVYGIYLSSSSNNNLTDNNASSNLNTGIFVTSSDNNTFTNNNANSNIGPTGGTGITLVNSFNNNFTDNTANSNTVYGIYLSSSSNNNLTDNTANSNTYGIYLSGIAVPPSSSDNNTFTDNTATGNTLWDVYSLDGSLNNIVTDLTTQQNLISFTFKDIALKGLIATQVTAYIQPDPIAGKDAMVDKGLPGDNFGGSEYITIGNSSPSNQTKRGLFQFDLSLIPPGTVIKQAALYLYIVNVTSPRVSNIYRINQSWDESTVNWSSQPTYSDVIGTIPINSSDRWYAIDITTAVQNWFNLSWANDGFLIKSSNEGILSWYRILSSDYVLDPTLRPLLVVWSPAQQPDPVNYTNIGEYVNATNTSADGWLYLKFSYSISNGTNDSTFRIWMYNASVPGWTNGSFYNPSQYGVNQSASYVYANVTSFASTFGPFGAEQCDGGPCCCPEYHQFLSAGTSCGAVAGPCENQGTCSGSSSDCPGNTPKDEGDSCSNGDLCIVGETCDEDGECLGGAPPNCDDGNSCTDDSCDPATGCANDNNDANPCSDGLACTSGDYCLGGVCTPLINNCGGGGGGCSKPWTCGAWGPCSNGIQTRVCDCGCADDNDCYGDHTTTRSCTQMPSASRECANASDCAPQTCKVASCTDVPCVNTSGCTCTPTNCSSLGKNCGSWSDGCGGTLNCGFCRGDQTCSNGVCTDTTSGCVDSSREAFTNVATYPSIAGCSGSWTKNNLRDTGPGTASALCAAGWHVCMINGQPYDLSSRLDPQAENCNDAGTGAWVVASNHCSAPIIGCTYGGAPFECSVQETRTNICTPTCNPYFNSCALPICCGSACSVPGDGCDSGVWGSGTRTLGGSDVGYGCGNFPKSGAVSGVLCCKDPCGGQSQLSAACDANCDGQVDEGCVCQNGVTQSCDTGRLGVCATGTQTCTGGAWGACVGVSPLPYPEVCCNGLDDNCNGQVDEGCTDGGDKECEDTCTPGQYCDVNGQCAWGYCDPPCIYPKTCDANGQCVCTPDCASKPCGYKGCGGVCGTSCGPACKWTCNTDWYPFLCNLGVDWWQISRNYILVNVFYQTPSDLWTLVCNFSRVCTPNCNGKTCGDDGCGGSCGTCTSPKTCNASGQCVSAGTSCDDVNRQCIYTPIPGCCATASDCAPQTCKVASCTAVSCASTSLCTPDCAGKTCGDDGCGGSCGTCADGGDCNANGQCARCDPPCVVPKFCGANGQCACTPDCASKPCGYKGCGGSCGQSTSCSVPPICYWVGGDECISRFTCSLFDANGRCLLFTPCIQGILQCDFWRLRCTPNCNGKTCGDDGCGGSCGPCTSPKTCDANGQCVPAGTSCDDVNRQCIYTPLPGCCTTAADCNDSNACTTDSCDTTNGICVNSAVVCPAGQTCSNGACVTPCTTVADCDDGTACTTDSCTNGICVYVNNNNPCSDGDDLCTVGDTCAGGFCVSGDNTCACVNDTDCAQRTCKVASCVNNVCLYNDTLGSSCDDGNACTENDYCSSDGLCTGPFTCPCLSDTDCGDRNPCTSETCLDTICQYAQLTGSCSDSNDCTTGDYCSNGLCNPSKNICKKCGKDWDCTVWTHCTAGTQTRSCTCDCANLNCGGDGTTIRSCAALLSMSIVAEPNLQVGEILHITITDELENPVVAGVVVTRPDGTILNPGQVSEAAYTVGLLGNWTIHASKEGYTDAEAVSKVGGAPPAPDLATQITQALQSVVTFITKEPITFALLLCTVFGLVGVFIYWKRRGKKGEIEKL